MSAPIPAVAPTRSRSMLRIFLSYTSKDLKNHRAAVRAMVDKFDEHPVVMGDFGTRDGDATAVSLERVRSCDVYVLLLGWRYGSIPATETLSVTHLEYRAARDAGMPRLIFLANPATEKDDGPDALFPAVRDLEHATLLRAFHNEVSHDRVIATFTTPDNVAAVVAPALYHVLKTIPLPGPRPPYRLAPRAPEFVGRTSELADLCQRLRAGEGVTLNNLGELARRLGQPDEAWTYYEQALAIFQEIGDMVHVRGVTNNMAYLDAGNIASGAPQTDTEAKTPTRHRWRWPWQRKPTK